MCSQFTGQFEPSSWAKRDSRSATSRATVRESRLTFGPLSLTRVRRWLHDGDFDVLHLHSPETFSLSLLALMNARGPIVATFHAAQMRSRILAVLQSPLQVHIEKIVGRIAVSPAARKTIVEHLGADAVVVPNGVHVDRFADAAPLDGWPSAGGAIGFVGRIDEPRKGLSVLLEAMPYLWKEHPLLRLLIAGPGEIDDRLDDRVVLLGQVDDKTKARAYHSVDAFVAPNIGGESFGIILLEAMAAGTPVVASDLDAFRRVLETTDGSSAGVLATVGDPESLAHAIATVLGSGIAALDATIVATATIVPMPIRPAKGTVFCEKTMAQPIANPASAAQRAPPSPRYRAQHQGWARRIPGAAGATAALISRRRSW